jgi:hypothetical protein
MGSSAGFISRNAKQESAQKWGVFYKTQQLHTIQSASSDHHHTASSKSHSKERDLMNIQALQATKTRLRNHEKKRYDQQ